MSLPNNWLIHTVDYYEKLPKRDEYGNVQYADVRKVSDVFVQSSRVYSRSGTETSLVSEGIIFTNTNIRFIEESLIIHDGIEYTVTKVSPIYDLVKGTLSHYEVEVI